MQADELEWERLAPAFEFAYNTTSHSSADLNAIEVMRGHNPLTTADLEIVGSLAPTFTTPTTNVFRQLCDRAKGYNMRATWQQKMCTDTRQREITYQNVDLVLISRRDL